MAGEPDCFNELYEEAMMIDKECNGSIGFADVQKMKKLDSFVKEVLRHSDDTLKRLHKVISESIRFPTAIQFQKIFMVMMLMNLKPFRFVNENSPATKLIVIMLFFGEENMHVPVDFLLFMRQKLYFIN
ncbi:unnamed protein product [Rhizophagus irregularis]|nr:unnamed protein product [Rhizophagus irregularis]